MVQIPFDISDMVKVASGLFPWKHVLTYEDDNGVEIREYESPRFVLRTFDVGTSRCFNLHSKDNRNFFRYFTQANLSQPLHNEIRPATYRLDENGKILEFRWFYNNQDITERVRQFARDNNYWYSHDMFDEDTWNLFVLSNRLE